MGEFSRVVWLCALVFVSSTQARTISPRAGGKPDPRDIWGLVNVWEGDDMGNLPSGLCSHLQGNPQPGIVLIPNEFGGYPGPGVVQPFVPPSPHTSPGYLPPFGGHGYTSGIHQANNYGGFSGHAATTPLVPPPYLPPSGGHGYTQGGHQANEYGGFTGIPVSAPVSPVPHQSPGYIPPNSGHGYTSGIHEANNYGGFTGVPVSAPPHPSTGTGTSFVDPTLIRPGPGGQYPPTYVVGGAGQSYNNAQSSSEHTAFEQQKEHESHSSGAQNNYYGANNVGVGVGRPYGVGASQVVAVQGNEFANSDSSKESSNFEQNKESSSASSGQQGNYYGAGSSNTGYNPYPQYGASQVVAGQGSNFQTSNSNKESIKAQSQKESNSASSGSSGQYYGAATSGDCGGRPCPYNRPYGASQVVAADASNFQTSNSNKEFSSLEQNKESNSASSGSTGQYYGGATVGVSDCGGRPCPYNRPYGASQVVAADASNFQTSNSNKESIKAESQKESNSASSGSTGQYYGAAATTGDCGGRPCPYTRPYGASQVVAAEGAEFQTSNSNKESTKAESQKQSNSASSGSTGQYYGAAAGYTGQPGRPIGGASQVVSGQGSQFSTANSDSESSKLEHSKESNSASSGSTGQYYGQSGVGVGVGVNRPYVGASQVVAADASNFQNSASSKESTKAEQNKASSSSSSGQQGGYYGATNTGSYSPYGVGASQIVAGQGSEFSTSNSDSESSKFEQNKESNSASSGSTGQYYGQSGVGVGVGVNRPYVGASQVVAADASNFQNSASSKESTKAEQNKASSSSSSGQQGGYYGASNTGPYGVGTSQVVAGQGSEFSTSNSDSESSKLEHSKESNSASSGSTGQYYGESGIGVGVGVDRRPAYVGASQVVAADASNFQNSASSKESSKAEHNKASSSSSSGQQGGYYGASNTGAYSPYGVGASQAVAGQGSQFSTSSSDSESSKAEHNKESASSSSGSQAALVAANSDTAYVYGGRPSSQIVSVGSQGAEFQNSESSKESSKLEHASEHAAAASGTDAQYVAANTVGLGYNSPVAGGSQFVAGSGTAFQTSSRDKELTKFDEEKSHSSSSSGSAAANKAIVSVDGRQALALVAAGSEYSPVAVRPPSPRAGGVLRYDCSGCKNLG